MQRHIGLPIDFSSPSKEKKTIRELKSVFNDPAEHAEIIHYLLSHSSKKQAVYQLLPLSKKIIEETNSVRLRLYRFNNQIEKLVRETQGKKEEIEFPVPMPIFEHGIELSSAHVLHKHFKLNFSPQLLPVGVETQREKSPNDWLVLMRNIHFFEMNIPPAGLEPIHHKNNGIHHYFWAPLS